MLEKLDWKFCRRTDSNPIYLAKVSELTDAFAEIGLKTLNTQKIRARLKFTDTIHSVVAVKGALPIIQEHGLPYITPTGVYLLVSLLPLRDGATWTYKLAMLKRGLFKYCSDVVAKSRDDYIRTLQKAEMYQIARKKAMEAIAEGSETDFEDNMPKMATVTSALARLARPIKLKDFESLLGLPMSTVKYQFATARDIYSVDAPEGDLSSGQITAFLMCCSQAHQLTERMFYAAASTHLDMLLSDEFTKQDVPQFVSPSLQMPVESDLSFLD